MKQGDKVVCIRQGKWYALIASTEKYIHPKFGDIVTIDHLEQLFTFNGYLFLIEHINNGSYDPKYFVPLADWGEACEFLESIKNIDQPVMDHSQDAKPYVLGGNRS